MARGKCLRIILPDYKMGGNCQGPGWVGVVGTLGALDPEAGD